MGVKDIAKVMKLKAEMDRVQSHGERVFTKIDEEMYLISKSEKDEKKKDEAQKHLAIFIIAELMDSFEGEDLKQIKEIFDRTFK